MTRSLIDHQSELPRSVPLFRFAPDRTPFSWREFNPALVRSASDIPQYLILGDLDHSTFKPTSKGWSARWQGNESATHFDVTYKAESEQWKISQTWCGLDGGFGIFPAAMPLNKAIAEGLYMQFPRAWDRAAKLQLESTYQITIVEQAKNTYAFFGIPDGAFRTIAFPIAVHNLRPVRQWIRDIVNESPLTYPITVEAKLVFQALNYLEGKAPAWTSQGATTFNQSVAETGLAPQALPVREEANDGSAAWTLRRQIYFLFIGLPFAGLTDFLSRMVSANGPVRTILDPDFRFGLRPIVFPAGFETQAESLAIWDKARTTRSFLQFSYSDEPKITLMGEDIIKDEKTANETLAKVEAISGTVVTTVEQIFQRVNKGNSP